MSGIDEQDRDVTLCGCKNFTYWYIKDNGSTIGFLNPDVWMKKDRVSSVNRREKFRDLSQEAFIKRITHFECANCGREIRKNHSMFGILFSNVKRRWDVKRVGDR